MGAPLSRREEALKVSTMVRCLAPYSEARVGMGLKAVWKFGGAER